MFLAIKEMKHSKTRFALIGAIIMLIAWLVFISFSSIFRLTRHQLFLASNPAFLSLML